MADKKSALIIANARYQDGVLRQLVAPAGDAEALAEVLRDPVIGGFEVETLLDEPSYNVSERVEGFFEDRERDHLLLLYFSGHGVTDQDGLLYFATSNTQHNRLRSTAVAARWVNEVMIQCRSRRQVLLLDCCHSGAFVRAKAGSGVSIGQHFEANTRDEGRGRVVLTASDAMQYSFEGDEIKGKAVRSVFTHAVVEGLRTGEADLDGDGLISLDELYSYVHRRVKDQTPQQSPRRWDFDVEGGIVIARNARPIAAELPEDLRHAIESWVPDAREAAIRRLNGLLRGKHQGLALAAHKAMLSLKEDDSRRVSSAAEKCLAAYESCLLENGQAAERITPEAGEARQKAEAEEIAPPEVESKVQEAEAADRPLITVSVVVLVLVLGLAVWHFVPSSVNEQHERLTASSSNTPDARTMREVPETSDRVASSKPPANEHRNNPDTVPREPAVLPASSKPVTGESNQLADAHPTTTAGNPMNQNVFTDADTALTWARTDNGNDIAWEVADKYCKELELAGYSDWRLPTIDELEKLYDPKGGKEYNVRKPFRLTSFFVWSSTKERSDSVWNFNFGVGRRYSNPMGFSLGLRALCVRRSRE